MGDRRNSNRRQKQDGDGWTCKLCDKRYSDEKAELLECEYCEGHFCRPCLGLSGAEYKLLGKRSDFHWYCPPCEEKTLKNIKIEKEIEVRCREYFDKYEERLHNLEKMMSKKPDVEVVQEMIEASKSNAATGGEGNIDQMNENLEEYKESMSRRCNIIIFNADESEETEPRERKAEDERSVKELCIITEADYETVKNVTRLGKKSTEADKPRPMRVIFEDEKSKGKFMSNLKNLGSKSCKEKYKKLSVTHDMTQKERQISKEKFEEAKEKNKNDESGEYKFIVKGPPWERKVVKVKKKE